MRLLLALGIIALSAQFAVADVVISEWIYSAENGEYIEFTNIGPDSVDMTGWSYDDDSGTPGTVDLSAFGVIEAGESVILTEADATEFATAWGLTDVTVIGDLSANLGRGDEIFLFDAASVLIDQLAYGDEDYPGTPRTKDASCNIPATDYGFTVAQTTWSLATVGDSFGSWTSAGGDIGSPGIVPEPTTLILLAGGALSLLRRRS